MGQLAQSACPSVTGKVLELSAVGAMILSGPCRSTSSMCLEMKEFLAPDPDAVPEREPRLQAPHESIPDRLTDRKVPTGVAFARARQTRVGLSRISAPGTLRQFAALHEVSGAEGQTVRPRPAPLDGR